MTNDSTQIKWYEKSAIMWIFLFFIPPIGLILLFLNRKKHPRWIAIAILGVLWILVLENVPKKSPPAPSQTQVVNQISESSQKQTVTPQKKIYSIGLTDDEFNSRFAEVSQQMAGIRIDLSKGEFSTGEKRDVSTFETNDGVALQKWINKDKTINAILILANMDQTSATALVGYVGLTIATIEPSMSTEEIKNLIGKLITPPKGEREFENRVVNNEIVYTLTQSDKTGILFTANNKSE